MAKPAHSPTFESILDTPADEVERPTPAPAGTYDFIVRGMPEQGLSSVKKTPYVRFILAFVSAGNDVNEEELTKWLTNSDGERIPLTDRTIRLTFYTTPDALFRLTDFFEHCGLEVKGKTVRQLLDDTPNASVRGTVSHRPSEDGESIFAEIKRTMPVD